MDFKTDKKRFACTIFFEALNNLNKELNLSDRVVECILTLEGTDLETLSVKSLSNKLGVSEFQLWRSFKIEKEMNLQEYIFRIKIHRAAVLLHDQIDLPIKKIASKVGYYSYGYFIKVFKRYFGTTPGKYREMKIDGKLNKNY
jgi:AraC-like DNA-binding protein